MLSSLPPSLVYLVSFLVACAVAFFRNYRFKKFQQSSKSTRKDKEPSAGVTGLFGCQRDKAGGVTGLFGCQRDKAGGVTGLFGC